MYACYLTIDLYVAILASESNYTFFETIIMGSKHSKVLAYT